MNLNKKMGNIISLNNNKNEMNSPNNSGNNYNIIRLTNNSNKKHGNNSVQNKNQNQEKIINSKIFSLFLKY